MAANEWPVPPGSATREDLTPLRVPEGGSVAVTAAGAVTGTALLVRAKLLLRHEVEMLHETERSDGVDAVGALAEQADAVTERRDARTTALETARESMRQLSERTNAAREAAQPALPRAVREERMTAMEAQHRALLDAILAGAGETERLARDRDAIVSACAAARAELDRATAEDDARLSFQAYLVETLIRLTDTRLTSTVDEGRVRGVVVKKSEHDVIPFDIDRTSTPEFDLVNHLWGIVSRGEAAAGNVAAQ